MDPKQILDLPMGENDADALTVRGYLKELLRTLWDEGECFSGKRPFGNSGWEHELHTALAMAGAVQGTKYEEDRFYDLSKEEVKRANTLIFKAIEALQ
jgi:hypothetical protein